MQREDPQARTESLLEESGTGTEHMYQELTNPCRLMPDPQTPPKKISLQALLRAGAADIQVLAGRSKHVLLTPLQFLDTPESHRDHGTCCSASYHPISQISIHVAAALLGQQTSICPCKACRVPAPRRPSTTARCFCRRLLAPTPPSATLPPAGLYYLILSGSAGTF
jgi:hypothetical protein